MLESMTQVKQWQTQYFPDRGIEPLQGVAASDMGAFQ